MERQNSTTDARGRVLYFPRERREVFRDCTVVPAAEKVALPAQLFLLTAPPRVDQGLQVCRLIRKESLPP